eukprot:gene27204-33490_t
MPDIRELSDESGDVQFEEFMARIMPGLPPEVRQILYYPEEEDVAFYPLLLRGPGPGAPQDDPKFKIQVAAVMVLYLHHGKNTQFTRTFIMEGGLRSLVALFTHPNLHLRGQVLETFHFLTTDEICLWFDKPEDPRLDRDLPLRRRMFELSRADMVKNLLANYEGSFPGGSQIALEIFGFYISWLRLHYCKDNVMQLSQEMLDLLEKWHLRTESNAEEKE